jgi:hypothetical protein
MQPACCVVNLTGVSYSVNNQHYNDNHDIMRFDIGHDETPITYAPGFNASRGNNNRAIPIAYEHQGNHNTSGSIKTSVSVDSRGSNHERRHDSQLERDLNGMVSSPEGARQAFQIPAGTERSPQDIDSHEDHYPFGVSVKRTTEMYDREESWVLQQSHESDRDTNFMINGRNALRSNSNDMMQNDMPQMHVANRSGNDHATHGHQMVVQGMGSGSHHVHQRNPSGV